MSVLLLVDDVGVSTLVGFGAVNARGSGPPNVLSIHSCTCPAGDSLEQSEVI